MKTKYFKQAYGSFSHIACFFLLAVFFGFTSLAEASLSAAGAYNVFVFENANLVNDSEGSMAIGGNATLTNYGVASKLSGSDARLVVGGSLTATDVQVGTGGSGTIYTQTGTTVAIRTNALTGTLANSGVDFNAAKADLIAFSKRLGGMTDNGVHGFNNGLLSLTGTNLGLNIFNVYGSNFNSSRSDAISGFFIDAPKGSTVLINIKGDVSSFANNYFNNGSLTGVGAFDVLYNFCDDTGFELYSGVEGSILAPMATVNFNNGQLNGQIVAKSLLGSGEYHLKPFSGTIPTPIPGSLLLFGTGLLGLVSIKRKRYR